MHPLVMHQQTVIFYTSSEAIALFLVIGIVQNKKETRCASSREVDLKAVEFINTNGNISFIPITFFMYFDTLILQPAPRLAAAALQNCEVCL